MQASDTLTRAVVSRAAELDYRNRLAIHRLSKDSHSNCEDGNHPSIPLAVNDTCVERLVCETSSPFGLIVLLHEVQILALLGDPTFNTSLEGQTLHICVSVVIDVVRKPCGCTIAAAARRSYIGISREHTSGSRVSPRLTAVEYYATRTCCFEKTVQSRSGREEALCRQIDRAAYCASL